MDDQRGRREFLAAASAGAAGLAGCGRVAGGGRDRTERVSLLAAGSLQHALDAGLRDAVDVPLTVEAHGSAAAARFVAEDQKDPDVLSLADVALFDGLAPWHVTFATNELVVAYNDGTAGGRRVADAGADRWYAPLLDDDVALGRTDPDLDPLGYRTLFALDLATDHYGTDADLRRAVPERDQVYPETQLLAAFETGAVDAAVVYRSMAVDRGYGFHALPPAVNLGDPDRADHYAATSYELPDGTVVEGDAVRYGATARRRTESVADVFEAHVAADYLAAFGFTVPDRYPEQEGDVPPRFAV